jgi:SAM-dependent methyltransferase
MPSVTPSGTNPVPPADTPSDSRTTVTARGVLDWRPWADRIAGWAWDSTRPDDPVCVEVHEDQKHVATVVADRFRQDLLDAGIGNGKHGFWFPIPASMKDLQPHVVSATISGCGVHLANSPLTLQWRTEEDLWNLARSRWVTTTPHLGLTWGHRLSGDNFIAKVEAYGGLGKDRSVLEIGPGYGRLLTALLQRQGAFGQYCGVDISEQNVAFLRERYGRPDIRFVHADAENVVLDGRYDTVVSSLTLKHLYPTLEKALGNIAGFVDAGGLFVFDLLEGTGSSFAKNPKGTHTYVRRYTRADVQDILSRMPLRLVAFDHVEHHPKFTRLLVVAEKQPECRA